MFVMLIQKTMFLSNNGESNIEVITMDKTVYEKFLFFFNVTYAIRCFTRRQ